MIQVHPTLYDIIRIIVAFLEVVAFVVLIAVLLPNIIYWIQRVFPPDHGPPPYPPPNQSIGLWITFGVAAILGIAGFVVFEPRDITNGPPPPEPTPTIVPINGPPTPIPTPERFELLFLTSPVRPEEEAKAQIRTSPNANCEISYRTPSGTNSSARGLGEQEADDDGICFWEWFIGSGTNPGTGMVTIKVGDDIQSFPIEITE